ncbi:hypothetical protein D3C75_1009280 [compost metagenome]
MRHGLLQVRAGPASLATGGDHQRLQALFAVGVVADLQAIQVQGLAQPLDLRPRYLGLGAAELTEVLGCDDAGQQAEYYQDHQEFKQSEATLRVGSALHGETLHCMGTSVDMHHATAVHVCLGALRHAAQEAAQCLRRGDCPRVFRGISPTSGATTKRRPACVDSSLV